MSSSIQERTPGQPSFARRVRIMAWASLIVLVLAVWEVAALRMVPLEAALAVSFGAMGAGALLLWLSRMPSAAHPRQPRPTGNTVRDLVPAASAEAEASVLNGKRWSLDVFAHIDSKRFAAVCETWFTWAGFETRSQSHQTEEGVDIWLHASKIPGPVAIVRCKHWRNRPVDLQDMKDFSRLMSAHRSAHGTFTTTSTYTPEALQFARENGIDAVDGRGLLRRIQTRTRQSQQALLAVAYGSHA